MKFTAEQTKTFLRLKRKHNVSVACVMRNMPAILKFVQYATTLHTILMVQPIRKHNRIILRHNSLRKFLYDPALSKKRRKVKRIHSQWSKHMVTHLRSYKIKEYFEDEVPESKLPEEVVSKQLKEQLELLKSGKRTVPLLVEANSVEQKEIMREALGAAMDAAQEVVCDVDEDVEEAAEDANVTEDDVPESVAKEDNINQEEASSQKQVHLMEVIDLVDDGSKSSFTGEADHDDNKTTKALVLASEKPNGNFLDMLISKVKSTTDDHGGECDSAAEKPAESRKAVETAERENSNSSSDFFGFDDSERIPGTFPGMLSTPLVHNRDFNSAFESETLNAYMRDNSLESSTVVDFPKRRLEDGLVYTNSPPPKLDMPALPDGLQGLRTVAERRIFLQKSKNLKYCIINNVGTIFRELQKRLKGHRINRNAIEVLQTSSPIPLTRQGWKAASWLLTDEGNYYFQTITVDGKNVRLFGGRGNSRTKFRRPHTNKQPTLTSICTEDCVDRITFRAFRPIRTLERRSKLSDAAKKIVYKACPLSQKIHQRPKDEEPFYGSLEIVRMPQIELEVFPQLQKPLNDIAKRYLQLILPYDKISREWANFSVSTLLDGQKMGLSSPDSQQSFTFTIPFANDRSHVLVRRVFNRCEAFDDDTKLTFRKELDQKEADGQPLDIVAVECADILTDMLNSVAISCSENSFIKNDPDNIYEYGDHDDEIMVEKSVKKSIEVHPQIGHHNKKQSRLLMELKRLNATIIDAATTKLEEDGVTCDKEPCKLGCICASLNEGSTLRQHCGKQKCIIDCTCKCPSIMRLETDQGRTLTTEDAFMLRRQATAKLARMEKDFTSTIVLTGSETLLINESQYDKKRRCTKIPKRYGDFVDPDDSDFNDSKPPAKRTDTPSSINYPLEPVMVKDKVYQHLKHCAVKVKRMKDVNDLAPWCMVHMVYKCHCKGRALVGSPIVVEKQEELTGGTTIDEVSASKGRTLYSFDKEESKANDDDTSSSSYESDTEDYSASDDASRSSSMRRRSRQRGKRDNRGRLADMDYLATYMNAKANHCRRVVPIPRGTYQRRNKKRVARVQLYIAENETDETKLSLNEHVLRSVYYHRNHPLPTKSKTLPEKEVPNETTKVSESAKSAKRKMPEEKVITEDEVITNKKRRMTVEEGSSLLRVNRYKDGKQNHNSAAANRASSSSKAVSSPGEQITVPIISKIFSLNAKAIEMGTDTAAAVAAEIPQQSTEAANSAAGVSSEAFRNVFQVVIKNMNSLVSKKMQDIDMALKRESRAIPNPNEEILCILRWNNFLEAFEKKFVYLWEVRTSNSTFMAGTIHNIMPLVVNALSVVNIRALPTEGLPLLGRMLMDKVKTSVTDGLSVVMQGQKLFWYVKGFLRPDKTRVCPKPTPETHPLLTKKINVLCRLLINQQINEHKKRQDVHPQPIPKISPTPTSSVASASASASPSPSPSPMSATFIPPKTEMTPVQPPVQVPPKLKVLPIQRNISDNATIILEQMVRQAYGSVQTNIAFRKLRKSEMSEIYKPLNVSTDHNWLVLDLSNDFSHIFIPDLRDLLTLDRIQKVMTYAVNRTRIVKLQFNQRAPFNAYVTPMSRRKIYFGPFRTCVQKPKLILLQSVDGQMMLREVYEERHNVTRKVDKTTAFWLVQKDGKHVIDIDQSSSELAPQTHGDIHEIIDDDVSIVKEVQAPQSKIPKQSEEEDDDDCFIVDDEEPAPAPSTINKVPPERLNYTISYTGENSSLVVIQNQCDKTPTVSDNPTAGNFTILQPHANLEAPKALGNFCSATEVQPDSDAIARFGKESGLALMPEVTSVPTSNAPTAIATSSPALVFALPWSTQLSDVNTGVIIKPTAPESIPVTETAETPKSADKIECETDSNVAKVGPSMQWNKNVTITKILVENENSAQPHSPQSSTNNAAHNAIPIAKFPTQNGIPKTVHFNVIQKPAIVRQAVLTPTVPKTTHFIPVRPSRPQTALNPSSSPQIRQASPATYRKSVYPALGSKITPQVVSAAQRLSGGLTVRTPTAINSIIRNQQMQANNSVRQPQAVVRSGSSLLRPMHPAKLSSVKAIKSPSKAAAGPQTDTARLSWKPAVVGDDPTPPKQLKRVVMPPLMTATKPKESNESDPLQIPENAQINVNSLPLPKLPHEVKTVHIAPVETPAVASLGQTPQSTSVEGTIAGAKRNSVGAIISARLAPTSATKTTNATATVVTSMDDSMPGPQSSQAKGIPIDNPRLKKFTIISKSRNTTVITPPSSEPNASEKQRTSDSSPAQPRKGVTNAIIKCSPAGVSSSQSRNLIKVVRPNSSAGHAKALTTVPPALSGDAEYGYFHANIEGLPKFVVKRVNEDFLIKVPNFNGILKLAGLKTVFNYLNQYTSQKCGRSEEEIANLKWTFKAQDRSKLNNINKSNAALVKPGTAGPIVQRQIFKKTSSSQRSPIGVISKPSTSTSQLPNTVKKIDPKEPIVLLDDE